MSSLAIGFTGVGVILLLIALRVPIGLSLGLVAFFGIAAITNFNIALSVLSLVPFETAASWELSAIPMFLLMGTLAFHSGLTTALFEAARLWLGRFPGGLAVATNFACAGFAAASGSSLATTLTMGRIALPEMKRNGYDMGLATGVVASAGTLGSLIPPSVLMILIGVFAQTSILKLFIAGVVPGLLSALAFATMIMVRVKLRPSLAPHGDVDVSFRQKLAATGGIWPLPLLVIGVIGGIYGGIVTATEAGAFGAALTFLVALVQGKLNWGVLKSSFWGALVGTASIFFIVIGAVLLTRFMAFSGLPAFLASIMSDGGITQVGVIVIAALTYFVLGMFLDPLGLLFLTLPVMLPVFKSVGLDLTLVGVLIVKFVEIGLMTPPVGLNVFAVKSLVGKEVSLGQIFRGVGWFLAVDIVVIALLVAFPEITLLLPRLMGL
ncbi:TRAP transporter large permease [Amorphus sp. 3PC139-8]|uniref:TRAP transporter large permease n=1 Tax=Amorphus sp. 3PC139-8 TaxID=2735676 RepID=UPI00345DA402